MEASRRARAAARPELGNSSSRARGEAAQHLSSAEGLGGGRNPGFEERVSAGALLALRRDSRGHRPLRRARGPQEPGLTTGEIGRASCRERDVVNLRAETVMPTVSSWAKMNGRS